MEIGARIVLFSFATMIATSAIAQDTKSLERAMFVRDSLSGVLEDARTEYGRNEAKRKELTPTILRLEGELRAAQQSYMSLAAAYSEQDIAAAKKNYDATKQQVAKSSQTNQSDVESAYKPNAARVRGNLIENDYFRERLSKVDYQTLREAQRSESVAKARVEEYMVQYAELVALQRQYMECENRIQGDSLTLLFNSKADSMLKIESGIEESFSTLFYNKMYAYDLLMERAGLTKCLDLSASLVAKAEREISEVKDLYASNSLAAYFAKKRALVDYEMSIASELSLTKAYDSLRQVKTSLGNRDYRLSRVSLQRRSFIQYQDIEVKKSNFYNANNPIPRTEVYEYGTVYRVRLGLFSRRPNLSVMRGVTPLSYTDAYNDGLYAYFVGAFRTEQEARDGVVYLKRLGFKDPLISVWVDGEYYRTVEDMKRAQSWFNIEISGVPTLSDKVKGVISAHKADCTISRVGTSFIVGSFEGRAVADAIAAEIKKAEQGITVEVINRK